MKLKTPQRDTVTTINEDGSRFFLHPADVRGAWLIRRRLVALVLIGIYILLPWIQINGNPAVFLDVMNRRFHLFGFTLAAQDAWLMFFLVSGTAFGLFYITAFLGRIWCGWACPQTVFLDHVYRRVERWIDGDAPARRLLEDAPWDGVKITKRLTKHAVFVLLSFLIAHIFLAYFISIPELWRWMTHSPTEHWKAFVFVFAFTAILYANFSWFREQLCLIICPYGRLQSALVDEHSVNVAYDYQRGNPPGPVKDTTAGDCIDCRRCVQVCPTGIDIRQGLQMECIACTACIDACDEIMDKVHRPRGLIRYASERNLTGTGNKLLRPRTVLYTLLLLLGMSVAGYSLLQLKPFAATMSRMPGPPYYVGNEAVRNQFQIHLINKTTVPKIFSVEASAPGQSLITSSLFDGVRVEPMGEINTTYVIQVLREDFEGNFTVTLTISSDQTPQVQKQTVEFLGPDAALLRAATVQPAQ